MRQQACLGVGSALSMSIGAMLLFLFMFSRNPVVQFFIDYVTHWLLIAGLSFPCLGAFGASAAWCRNPCTLCTFAILSLLACTLCIVAGSIVYIQPPSDAVLYERLCEEANSTESLGTLGAPAVVISAQEAYDSLHEVLVACWRVNSVALGLNSCPDGTVASSRPWQTNPYLDLFQYLENTFSCSGFCSDGVSLFGLPEGAVNEDNCRRTRHACFPSIGYVLRQQAWFSGISLIVAGVFLLAPTTCACWLACAPPPLRRTNHIHHPDELGWIPISQDEDSDSDCATSAMSGEL